MIAPEEWGIIATAMIVLSILGVIIDGGFGAALIQRKQISRTDVSTVMYMNVALACIGFFFLLVAAKPIAVYFNQPDLTWIIPTLSITLLVASFGQSQSQMLSKGLHFKLLAKLTIPSILSGGLVGITMACFGFKAGALIGQQITINCVRTILLWVVCPRELQPNFGFSFSSFKKLAGFSFGVLGNSLLHRGTQNMTGLIVAKSFGAADLGFYNRARFFQQAPTTPLLRLLNRVLFPVFSEIQDDKTRLKSALRTGIPIAIGCVAPLMFWLIATAEPLILVVLTDVWSESTQYLRVVPLMGITLLLSGIKSNVIRSQGDGRLIFLLSLYRNAIILIGLLITWRFGIMAMIVGQVVCYCMNMIVNDYFTQRYTGYTMVEQWMDWTPYILLSCFSALLALPIAWTSISSSLVVLILQSLVFALAYGIGCKVLNLPIYQKVVGQIRQRTFFNNLWQGSA